MGIKLKNLKKINDNYRFIDNNEDVLVRVKGNRTQEEAELDGYMLWPAKEY